MLLPTWMRYWKNNASIVFKLPNIGFVPVIQFGGMPKDAKSFKGVGSGIIEIAVKYDKEAYRCVQAVQIGKSIYVLHAFQKKAKKGIATPQKDVDLIKKRYREAKEIEKNEQKN